MSAKDTISAYSTNDTVGADANTNAIEETKLKIKKETVCKNCNEVGHGVKSTLCKMNIDKNNNLKEQIKKYILTTDCLEKTMDEHFNDMSALFNITSNMCETLYKTIPIDELIVGRPINIDKYLQNITETLSKKCKECNKNMICIQANTHRIWNGNDICDTCWCKYEEQRNATWEKIQTYKKIECEICQIKQIHKSERFHYDHLNMFNKDKSICSMVNEGVCVEDICAEIDKCQILCLSCHHIVTDIEHKLGFTRIKQSLTRRLNQKELSEEEYDKMKTEYQAIYAKKMKQIYDHLKKMPILR
jgi:hypothetical protein